VKAKVDVCRTGYGHHIIEVEIPEQELKGLTLDGVRTRMEQEAIDKAGDYVFSEHDADYAATGVVLYGPCPSCGKERGGCKSDGLFMPGTQCEHCGHVEPEDQEFDEPESCKSCAQRGRCNKEEDGLEE